MYIYIDVYIYICNDIRYIIHCQCSSYTFTSIFSVISFCVAVFSKHLSAGSLGLGRPSVPPLNLDAAKLVAGDPRDAPSTTQRLKTLSSSRLSRRLKMEAGKIVNLRYEWDNLVI